MSIGPTFLGGAQSRLLPPSLPFRFFAAGIVFHILMWILLFLAADSAPDFAGGLGPALGTLHVLTLGVFGTVAIGAALQMLPVATRRPMPNAWPLRLAFWLYVPTVPILVHGMVAYDPLMMAIGGSFTGAGLLVLAILLGDNLRKSSDLPLVSAYGWLAVGSLFALVLLGLALVFDFTAAFLPDHNNVALAHLVVAVFGFMGMLAVGFSHILVPMFTLAQAPTGGIVRVGIFAWSTAILLAAAGALMASRPIFALGILSALGASAIYLWTMYKVWSRRMRKRMGLSFLLVRISWALLPLGLVLALAATFGLLGSRGPTIAGFVLIWGWMLTFIFGILQRIMPFLASMHAAKIKGKPPLLSELTAEKPLEIHAYAHFGALVLAAAGIAFGLPLLVQAGAAIGFIGSVAFAVFALVLIRRLFFVHGTAASDA